MTYSTIPETMVLAGARAPGRAASACSSTRLSAHWLRADYCVQYRQPTDSVQPIRASTDVAEFFRSTAPLENVWQEHMLVMALDAKNRPLGVFTVSVGGRTFASVDRSVILQAALLAGSQGFILCHNHPSGEPQPSPEDVEITRALKQGAELVGLKLIDHVIIAHGGRHFSFLDTGLL